VGGSDGTEPWARAGPAAAASPAPTTMAAVVRRRARVGDIGGMVARTASQECPTGSARELRRGLSAPCMVRQAIRPCQTVP
jgi:hypothetical protein